MPLLLETAIFYGLIGCGVAVAIYVRGETRSNVATLATCTAAAMFWPLFIPTLLSTNDTSDAVNAADEMLPLAATDPITAAINQVEAELDAALDGLDGWAENVLASE